MEVGAHLFLHDEQRKQVSLIWLSVSCRMSVFTWCSFWGDTCALRDVADFGSHSLQMMENRDKKKVKEKLNPEFYSYTAESLERALASNAHDPRGPRSHLQRLLDNAQGKGVIRT